MNSLFKKKLKYNRNFMSFKKLDHEQRMNLYYSKGIESFEKKDYVTSFNYFRSLNEYATKISHPAYVSQSMVSIGIILYKLKKMEESLNYFTKVINLNREGIDVATANHWSGIILYDQSNYSDAINYFKKSNEIVGKISEKHLEGLNDLYVLICDYKLKKNEKRCLRFIKKKFEKAKIENDEVTLSHIDDFMQKEKLNEIEENVNRNENFKGANEVNEQKEEVKIK